MQFVRAPIVFAVLLALAFPRAAPVEAYEAASSDAQVAARVAALLEDDRYEAATLVLRRHLAERSDDFFGWVQLGDVQRRRCDLDGARRAYWRALAGDLRNPLARTGLASIHLLEGDPRAALAETTLALTTPSGRRSGPAWRTHALALVDLGRYDLALDAAKRAIRVAPGYDGALEAYARAAFRAGDMQEARKAYTRALLIDPAGEEANIRLGSGFGPAFKDPSWRTGLEGKLFEHSVDAWDDGRLEEASARFDALTRRSPTNFKYRLGYGLVRRDLRRRAEVAFGGDISATYFLLPAPQVPLLSAYVMGWDDLDERTQRIVRTSVAPARAWLPQLIEARATHEILSLSDSLSDHPKRRDLADRFTFDGRRYAHLRGVGGRAAATGIEKLRTASAFGFNTFAHEFAHQVLRQAFPRELVREVERLYADALRTDRCLDYYAASNVDEYFAQGYEALVSLRKRGCLRDTARHTRSELKRRDPRLFAFLVEHMDLTHEDEGAMERFWQALPP